MPSALLGSDREGERGEQSRNNRITYPGVRESRIYNFSRLLYRNSKHLVTFEMLLVTSPEASEVPGFAFFTVFNWSVDIREDVFAFFNQKVPSHLLSQLPSGAFSQSEERSHWPSPPIS